MDVTDRQTDNINGYERKNGSLSPGRNGLCTTALFQAAKDPPTKVFDSTRTPGAIGGPTSTYLFPLVRQ